MPAGPQDPRARSIVHLASRLDFVTLKLFAAIVEEHFPMAALTDPHAFYGSGGDDAELSRRMTELMASVARFGADQGLDLVPTSRFFWTLS